jgi:class 3 adenylate cyclase/tetratricopeptide (TPR) repeat protein
MTDPMADARVERRVVTALFVDVVGSTALTVALGPERFKRDLDRAFGELAALIAAEGGTVEKYVGDAIHALFGAPIAHADDPQRALRAARSCVRWTDRQKQSQVAFTVRIAVETGEAIVDLGAVEDERQRMSVGACVNVAARLQQLAEPGQILVGPVCHDATADVGEFTDLGDIELRGLGGVRAWRLTGLAGRRPGGIPLVGREAELGLLALAARRARSAHAVFTLVSGPPGQGKTRLVEEFVAGLPDNARVLRARCRPAGELGARSPLQELLASAAATFTEDDAGIADLTGAVARLFDDATERDRVVTALAHSAGLSVSRELSSLPTSQRQDEVANAWRRYLAALARGRLVVLWVEDLHWAEAEVVQLLDRLTLGLHLPLLVIGTARPEFTIQGGMRPGGDRFFVALDALDDVAAHALAHAAGNAEMRGLERAGGNPLFIIELVRARPIGAVDVPLTLHGVIGARLDELPPPDRELLQRAAVVGEAFTVHDAALLAESDPGEVAATLERLAGLLYVHEVAGGFRFHHALVRDVAYGRLTTAVRMRLHAHYAREGVRSNDVEAVAHHLWEALGPADADWVWEGNPGLAELQARACEAHQAAARRYADRFAYAWALETCRRAFRFTTDPRAVAAIERALGDVLLGSGDADEAWSHYMRARDLYREQGADPPPDLYPIALEPPVYTAGMFRRRPDEPVIETLASEGETLARRIGDRASLARLLAVRAYRLHEAAALEEALRLSEEVADPTALEPFLVHAAILQIRAGEFAVARRIFERLDAIAVPPGPIGERAFEFRAILALSTGRLPEAQYLADRLVAKSAARGPHLRTHAYREQAHVLLARGDWPALRDVAAEAERLVDEHPDTAFCYAVTTARAFKAVAHMMEGQGDQALAVLRRAVEPLQAEPLERESVLLLAHAVVGGRDEVEALIREVYARGSQVFWFFQRMQVIALTMLQQWDAVEAALAPLERIAAKGNPYLEALVAAAREEIAAKRGGGPPAEHRALRNLGYTGWSELLAHCPHPAE